MKLKFGLERLDHYNLATASIDFEKRAKYEATRHFLHFMSDNELFNHKFIDDLRTARDEVSIHVYKEEQADFLIKTIRNIRNTGVFLDNPLMMVEIDRALEVLTQDVKV